MTRLAGTSAMKTGSARISGRAFAATTLRDRTSGVLADIDPAEIAHTARTPRVRAIAVPLKAASFATTPVHTARGFAVHAPLPRRLCRSSRVRPPYQTRRIAYG